MRLRITRDGRTEEVEVAADLASVTVAGHTFPVTVVATSPLRVELEIGGERVVVENWPDHFPEPPAPVDVNGERAGVVLERIASAGSPRSESYRPVAPPRPCLIEPLAEPCEFIRRPLLAHRSAHCQQHHGPGQNRPKAGRKVKRHRITVKPCARCGKAETLHVFNELLNGLAGIRAALSKAYWAAA